ncbi:hypothetical protein MMC22_003119 [Lobaria immixta]|nr:hypothetical protein [Lobaria immixta]
MDGSQYGKNVLVGTGVVFSILPIIAVGLRFYARTHTRANLGADDWVMIPALVTLVALGVVQIIAAEIGELGEHQTLGPDGQLLMTPQLRHYEKCKYAYHVSTCLSLSLIKVSVLLFYRRVFSTRSLRITYNIGIAITVLWGVAFTLANSFQCTPASTIWTQFEIDYTPYCVNQRQLYLAIAISDFLLDIIIFTLPLPPIFKLQLPLKQKFGLAGVFLLGSVVVGASITRMVIFAQTNTFASAHPIEYFTDITFYTAGTLFWTLIESSIGIVGACIPALWPLIARSQSKSSKSHTSVSSRRTPPATSRFKINDLSSNDSKTALSRERAQPSHSNEVYVEPISLHEMPRRGILVQREFSGGIA